MVSKFLTHILNQKKVKDFELSEDLSNYRNITDWAKKILSDGFETLEKSYGIEKKGKYIEFSKRKRLIDDLKAIKESKADFLGPFTTALLETVFEHERAIVHLDLKGNRKLTEDADLLHRTLIGSYKFSNLDCKRIGTEAVIGSFEADGINAKWMFHKSKIHGTVTVEGSEAKNMFLRAEIHENAEVKIEGSEARSIMFLRAEIHGTVTVEGSEAKNMFLRAEIHENAKVTVEGSTARNIMFDKAEIHGTVTVERSKVEYDMFLEAEIRGTVTVEGSTARNIMFDKAEIHGTVTVENSNADNEMFLRAEIHENAEVKIEGSKATWRIFDRAEIHENAEVKIENTEAGHMFFNAKIHGTVKIEGSKTGNMFHHDEIRGTVTVEGLEAKNMFNYAEIHKECTELSLIGANAKSFFEGAKFEESKKPLTIKYRDTKLPKIISEKRKIILEELPREE